jgi:hypothetical protein
MKNQISLREYLVVLFVAVLSPLVKIVPTRQAQTVGTGGWLTMLVVLVPILVLVWVISKVGRSLPERVGLGEVLCLCTGQGIGKALCVCYGVWFTLRATIGLRLCAERFVSTLYPDTAIDIFLLVTAALEWWLGRKKLPVMARTAQVFFYAVSLTVGIVLIMGISDVHLYNVFPFWTESIPKLAESCVPVLGIVGIGVGSLFLFGQVTDRRGGLKLTIGWAVGLCLLLTALAFVVMGSFGASMVERMQIPFFNLAKEVQIEGAIERLEALVVAMWVFTDVILLGLMLRSAQKAFSCAVGGEEIKLVSPLLLVLLPGAYLITGSAFSMEELYKRLFAMGDMVFFYGVPLAVVIVGKMRRVL